MNGLCPPETYRILTEMAALVQPGSVIVELGTYKGHGTVALIQGAPDGVDVYTVDTHDMPGARYSTATGPKSKRLDFTSPLIRKEAERRIDGRATMIQAESTLVGLSWTGPKVGLIMVDADHREGAIRRDFTSWEPHLERGALVCFDDYQEDRYPGVVRVVKRLADKGTIGEVAVYGTLAVAVKQ